MWRKFAARSKERTAQQEEQLARAIGKEAQDKLSRFLQDFTANPACSSITSPASYSQEETQYLRLLCKRFKLKAKFGRSDELLIRKASAAGAGNQLQLTPQTSAVLSRYFADRAMTVQERKFVWGELKVAPGLKHHQQPPQQAKAGAASFLTATATTSAPLPPLLPSPAPLLAARKLLPTWAHRDEILAKIASSDVTIIQGATGSGKSTQVVQYLLDQQAQEAGQQQRPVKVLCTQPRRLAAMALAARVARERGESEPGNTVGYAVRFDSNHSANTRLLFCTTGITLTSLRGGHSDGDGDGGNDNIGNIFAGVTHLVIDEVHERDRNADFLLIFVRELLLAQQQQQKDGPKLKLVLMSATMKIDAFERYFAGLACSNVEVEGRTFPVTSYFADDLPYALSLSGSSSSQPRGRAPSAAPAEPAVDHNLIVRLLDDISRNKYAVTVGSEDADSSANAVLVFLPGWGDIQDLSKLLHQHSKFGDRQQFRILALHSGIPPRDQMLVFARPPRGVTKIILSTNIAETSLTVEDVAYVIDSGLAKEKGYDAALRSSSLLPSYISQANAMQRRGRAGRCRPGVCFHLYTKQKFDSLAKFQVPELLRTPLDELCLNARSILTHNAAFFQGNSGTMSVERFLGKALDAPPAQSVLASIQTLVSIGAFDPQEQLTGLGRRLCTLPVEPKLGKTVLYGAMLGAVAQAVTLSVSSGFRDPFMFAVTPQEKTRLSQAKQRMSQSMPALGGASDHASVLTAYDGYVKAGSNRSAKYAYCDANFLSSAVMDQLGSMHRQVIDKLPPALKQPPSTSTPSSAAAASAAAVSALVCSVTFPNLALCEGKKLLCDPAHRRIKPHNSSSVELFRRHRGDEDQFYVFEELVRGANGCDLRVMTQMDAVCLALFGSTLNVFPSSSSVDKAAPVFRLVKGGGGDSTTASIALNSYFSLSASSRDAAEQLAVLRLRFETSFLNAMDRGAFVDEDYAVGRVVLDVLAAQQQHGQQKQQPQRGRRDGGGGGVGWDEEDEEEEEEEEEEEAEAAPSKPPSVAQSFQQRHPFLHSNRRP